MKLPKDNAIKIRARFRHYRSHIKTLETQFQQLTAQNNAMRAFMTDFLKTRCPVCGNRPIAMDWNKEVYVLVCDSTSCLAYRRPLGNLNKEILRGAGISLVE